jgi:hypothetical protein
MASSPQHRSIADVDPRGDEPVDVVAVPALPADAHAANAPPASTQDATAAACRRNRER